MYQLRHRHLLARVVRPVWEHSVVRPGDERGRAGLQRLHYIYQLLELSRRDLSVRRVSVLFKQAAAKGFYFAFLGCTVLLPLRRTL